MKLGAKQLFYCPLTIIRKDLVYIRSGVLNSPETLPQSCRVGGKLLQLNKKGNL